MVAVAVGTAACVGRWRRRWVSALEPAAKKRQIKGEKTYRDGSQGSPALTAPPARVGARCQIAVEDAWLGRQSDWGKGRWAVRP